MARELENTWSGVCTLGDNCVHINVSCVVCYKEGMSPIGYFHFISKYMWVNLSKVGKHLPGTLCKRPSVGWRHTLHTAEADPSRGPPSI